MKSRWEQRGIPNPGSLDAQERGCTCPVVDNHRGAGIQLDREVAFWIAEGCPIHAPASAVLP